MTILSFLLTAVSSACAALLIVRLRLVRPLQRKLAETQNDLDRAAADASGQRMKYENECILCSKERLIFSKEREATIEECVAVVINIKAKNLLQRDRQRIAAAIRKLQ